jgi:hypothetical protein
MVLAWYQHTFQFTYNNDVGRRHLLSVVPCAGSFVGTDLELRAQNISDVKNASFESKIASSVVVAFYLGCASV